MADLRVLTAVLVALAGGLVAGPSSAYDPVVVTPKDYRTVHPGTNTIDILATAEQTDGRFGIVISSDNHGGLWPPVRNGRSGESWFVLEGNYKFYVGDGVFEGGPGTLVFVDANENRGYLSQGAGRLLITYYPGGHEWFFIEWAARGIGSGLELDVLRRRFDAAPDGGAD